MRRLTFCTALAIAIAAASAVAQEQKTLGPCSPAVTGVNGNVTVTCETGEHRIRIAKFSGEIMLHSTELAEFISSNSGQIIYLDANLGLDDNISWLYYNDTLHRLDVVHNCDTRRCTLTRGVTLIEVYFTEIGNVENAVAKHHGEWHFRGYYLIGFDGCRDVGQHKTCEYRLHAIDDEKVALSDKYDTK